MLKSKLTTDAGLYMGFNVLEKIVPFIVLPIIARYLSKEDMGIYIVYQTFIALLLPFVSLNTDSSILINYFKLDQSNFKKYFYNAMIVFAFSLLVVIIVFILWPGSLSALLDFPEKWLFAVVIIVVFTYFIRLTLNLWQVEKKPRNYGIFSISLTLLKGGLLLLFVVVLKMGWDGVIISMLIAYAFFFLISLVVLIKRKTIKPIFSKEYVLDNLRVGGPLSLHQIGGWLGSQSNRLIINMLLGSAATGSFGIGAVYGTLVSVIQNAFNRAFTPYLFENLNNLNQRNKKKLVRITYYYNFSLLLFSLFIGVLGFLVNDYLFGVSYSSSKVFIIWMALGNAFNGLYKMHVNYIFFTKKTQYILFITLLLGIISVILSYFLIKLYGAIAGAQVFLFTQFMGYLLAWYIGNRLIPMPWFNILKGFNYGKN